MQSLGHCLPGVVGIGASPAEGFFDRVLLPDFACRPHSGDPFWDKVLTGRTAHIISTSDAVALAAPPV